MLKNKKLIKPLLLPICAILFSTVIHSQEPSVLWTSFYDGPIHDVDYFKHMVMDSNENIYVLCGTKGNISDYDVDITTYKVSSSGQIEWADSYSGSDNNSGDQPVDIVYDPNGYVISMGNLKTGGFVVVKYNLSGVDQWTYLSSSSSDVAYTMTRDDVGDIYIAGSTLSQNSANREGLIVKISPDGSEIFREGYIYGGTVSNWRVKIIKMINDLNGNLIVIGDCVRTLGNYYSCFISKISQSGSEQWHYVHSSDSLYMGDFVQANICVDADNYIYAASAAVVGTNSGYSDYLILKMNNSNGDIVWTVKTDGGANGPDNVKSILTDNLGNVYLSGFSRYFGNWNSHILMKMNASTGNLNWEKEIRNYNSSGTAALTINDFYIDDIGNFYISFPEIIRDMKKFNSDGDVLWALDIPGAYKGSAYPYTWMDKYISTVIKTPSGKIYMGCSGTLAGNYEPTDVMVGCIVENPSGVNDISSPEEFSLMQNFPNPFNPSTKIKYRLSTPEFVTLKVYDILGNEIASLVNEEKPAGSYEVTFDAKDLPSGIYFYRLQSGSFAETKKMTLLR